MNKEESEWVQDYIRDAKEMMRLSKSKTKKELEKEINDFIKLKAVEWKLNRSDS